MRKRHLRVPQDIQYASQGVASVSFKTLVLIVGLIQRRHELFPECREDVSCKSNRNQFEQPAREIKNQGWPAVLLSISLYTRSVLRIRFQGDDQ